MTLSFISVTTDYTFTLITQQHLFLFIFAIFTFAIAVILKSAKVFFLQLLLLFSFYVMTESSDSILYLLAGLIQVMIGIVVLYKLKKAIDYNYTLILEKTHKIPRHHTRNGDLATRKTFF